MRRFHFKLCIPQSLSTLIGTQLFCVEDVVKSLLLQIPEDEVAHAVRFYLGLDNSLEIQTPSNVRIWKNHEGITSLGPT